MVRSSPLQLLKYLRKELVPIYGEESDSLAMMLTEHFTKLSRTDIISDKPAITGPQFKAQIAKCLVRLKAQEPIQHILGSAHFYGHDFKVSPATLIPRPETEELVDLISSDAANQAGLRVLDIGTGSGCIAISLSLSLNKAVVEALDISPDALRIAIENNRALGADVTFHQRDILQESLGRTYDIIVSNPPYVTASEKQLMHDNVLQFEPPEALFVSNEKPLVFYERICQLAFEHLSQGGRLYFEINEQFGSAVKKLLEDSGFNEVHVIKDLMGKDRIAIGNKA
jgi:release factor glutamine methyltransferase